MALRSAQRMQARATLGCCVVVRPLARYLLGLVARRSSSKPKA